MTAAASASVLDDTSAVARRYAEALIGAAAKEGPVDRALDELAEIEELIRARFPRFGAHLASVRVTPTEKDRLIGAVLEGRASSLALRFLRVLNRHGRLGLFSAVIREGRALWDQQNRRVPVVVRSAVPLGEADVEALRNWLARVVDGTPLLSLTTEPELIGGLVVQVGDHRYDASVKNRLGQLRHQLIEGKKHEIQSRRNQFSDPA
jgi:F-type H+-transporting ATPase subunit delta